MKKRYTLSLDFELCQWIEEQRGDVARSKFVNQLLVGAIDGLKAKIPEEVGGYA